jgi:eukaryotic-like serine/threonine-protein kinase
MLDDQPVLASIASTRYIHTMPRPEGGASLPTGVGNGDDVSSVGSSHRNVDAAESPLSLAGTTVGRYRLLWPIGTGGMAQVWAAAAQSGVVRPVALKLVLPEFACDQEYGRMFVDEARVAAAVHHPNVCEVRELGNDGDRLFMVLELVPGDSLTGLIQRGSEFVPLPVEIAARIVAQACAGLHAAHEAVGADGQSLGIVHRDVSPPNILVSIQGHVKVSDFGIAKARYQLHERTRTGEIKGKFAYIPPEQIMARGVDRRADVYALGCVLYVATLGVRPFGSGAEALGKIVQGRYQRPREVRPDYPSGLEAIVVKALNAKPEQRFQTAEEMRLALEHWLVTENLLVMDSDVAKIVRERLSAERRAVVDAALNTGRSLPEELAQRLLSPKSNWEAPTAKSQISTPPNAPKAQASSAPRATPSKQPSGAKPSAALQPPASPDLPTWRPPKRDEDTRPGDRVADVEESTLRDLIPAALIPSIAPKKPR